MNGKKKQDFFVRAFHAICILFIFVVCVWNIGMQQRVRVVDDEFAYWGIAAQLAGFDWSGALSKTGYYSYGYSLFLVPFYWLVRLGVNMTVVYRMVIGMNGVFLCLSFCLAAAVGKRMFKEANPFLIQSAALLSVLYIGNVIQSGCAWTEVYLTFMFWCCLYCIVRFSERPSIKWIFFTLLSSAYLFAIHMRTLGVVLVAVFVVFLRLLLDEDEEKRKKLLTALVLLAVLIAAVLGMRYYVKNEIYMNNPATAGNDFAGQGKRIQTLFSAVGIVDYFLSVCGKIFYAGVVTFCLGIFAVFAAIRNVVQECLECLKARKIYLSSKWFVYLYMAGAAAGAVCVDALFQEVKYYSQNVTSAKADTVIYGRYIDFLIGSLILFGILHLYQDIEKHRIELLVSILALVGCGAATQKIWDILIFYNGPDLVLRGTGVPGMTYMIHGDAVKLAYSLITWAIAGLTVFLIALAADRRGKTGWRSAAFVCCLAALFFAVEGNSSIESGIIGKSHKLKTVDSIAHILEELPEETGIYYVMKPGTPNGDMKILQWELPDRTIQILQAESGEACMHDENAVYLADDSDDELNGALGSEGIYLYDSGTLSVYISKSSSIAADMGNNVRDAKACADPKPVGVDLAAAAAEFAYQKPNGNIYLSEQRTEAYLTGATGLMLDDGIYQFQVDMELSYYEDGDIGYITVTNTEGTWLDTRVLQKEDFDQKGKASVLVELPVRDHEEPVIGVYVYGNGAIKVTGITCTQLQGNIAAELGREDEWKRLADILTGFYRQHQGDICYVDTDASGRSGFPDFEWVSTIMPEPVSSYCTGEQLKYMNHFSCYLIMEKSEGDGTEYVPEGYQIVGESEHYLILAA